MESPNAQQVRFRRYYSPRMGEVRKMTSTDAVEDDRQKMLGGHTPGVVLRRPSRLSRKSARDFFVQQLPQGMRRLSRRNSAHCDLYSIGADLVHDAKALSAERHSHLYAMSSPMAANGRMDQNANEFFSFLERLQSQRLDDQRCAMPEVRDANQQGSKEIRRTRDTIREVLVRKPPYPQIVLPTNGGISCGFWMDGVSSCTINIDDEVVLTRSSSVSNSCARFKLETEDTSHCYRRHFIGRVNWHFIQ
jgi:hypothetical protein